LLKISPVVHSLVYHVKYVYFLVEIAVLNLLILIDVYVNLNKDLFIRLFGTLCPVGFLVLPGRGSRLMSLSQAHELIGVDSNLLTLSAGIRLALEVDCQDSVRFQLLSLYKGRPRPLGVLSIV